MQSWIYVTSLMRSLQAIVMSHKCRHRTVKIIPFLHFARLFRSFCNPSHKQWTHTMDKGKAEHSNGMKCLLSQKF
jgi:hypothetical protein